MVALLPTAKPQPILNESYADFVVRAHRELMPNVPEPDQRNQMVWDAWAAVHGDYERQRADQRFTTDKYVKRADVCYFSEHEANSVGPDGQPMIRRYDASKLAEIIDENNLRIADVDAYPTIVDRHTAPAGTRDPSPPDTLGVAGPFRLGMIGRVNPRFAVFTDEYVRRDKVPVMESKGGRSVELLTQKHTGRSYINPIAAISEAPRLPLPVQFSFGDAESEIVERYTAIAPYSATAAAFPGGGSTFVKKFDSQSDDPQADNQGPTMDDQVIRQIVDAIMNTEQMQWVTQQMKGSGTPAGGTPPQAAPAGGPPQQFGGGAMGMGGMGGGMMRYASEDGREPTGDDDMAERYQALLDGQRQLVEELNASQVRLAELEVAKADAERSARLQELAGRLPIDLNTELHRCLYQHGSRMDDEQFENHCDVVETYAAKAIEMMPMVPVGSLPKTHSDRETAKYQADLSGVIRELTNHYANQGVAKTYPELKAEAEQRLAS